MDRFPPLFRVKTFNNNEQNVSSNEKDDKDFQQTELNDLEELVTNLQGIADNFDLCTRQGDNRTITPNSQDEFVIGNNEQDSFISTSRSNRKCSLSSVDTFSNAYHETLFKTLPVSDNSHDNTRDTSLSGSIFQIPHNEVQANLNVSLKNSSKHFGPGYRFEWIARSSNSQSIKLLNKPSKMSNQEELPGNISFAFQLQKEIETGENTCFHANRIVSENSLDNDLEVAVPTHSRPKNHICLDCGKRFISKSKLERHSVAHSGEKQFTCDICPKRFFQKSHADRHRRTHTGEKPFQCEVCGKYFNRKSHLRRHAIVHKRNTQD